MESGEDLFALEALMATLRDWFVICQERVPSVCCEVGVYEWEVRSSRE